MARHTNDDATTTWILRRLASSIMKNSSIKLNVPPTVVSSDAGDGHQHFLQTGDDGYLRLNATLQDDHPQDGPSDWRGALDILRKLNKGSNSCVVRLNSLVVAVLPQFIPLRRRLCLLSEAVLETMSCALSYFPGVVCRKRARGNGHNFRSKAGRKHILEKTSGCTSRPCRSFRYEIWDLPR